MIKIMHKLLKISPSVPLLRGLGRGIKNELTFNNLGPSHSQVELKF